MVDLLKHYRWPLVGAGIGAVLVGLIMSFGFFKSLFLLLVVLGGAYLGFKLQQSGILEQWEEKNKKK